MENDGIEGRRNSPASNQPSIKVEMPDLSGLHPNLNTDLMPVSNLNYSFFIVLNFKLYTTYINLGIVHR
jgi:hypothetical protein